MTLFQLLELFISTFFVLSMVLGLISPTRPPTNALDVTNIYLNIVTHSVVLPLIAIICLRSTHVTSWRTYVIYCMAITYLVYVTIALRVNNRHFESPQLLLTGHTHQDVVPVLFVVAHPDDESMFFTPMISQITKDPRYSVFLLCLSTGNADGLGNRRLFEVHSCAHHVLAIPSENIVCIVLY